jgi:hypothetical protein
MKFAPLTGLALLALCGIGAQAAEESKAPAEPAGTTFRRTLKGAEETFTVSSTFLFEGGGPREFVSAIENHYHVDWFSVLTVSEDSLGLRIPKLRLTQRTENGILTDARLGPWLDEVVTLYNHVAENDPRLDKLLVEGYLPAPSLVMFIPRTAPSPLEMKVRAFPLAGIPKEDWDKLYEELQRARDEAMARIRESRRASGGNDRTGFEGSSASIHPGTRLLVACGTEVYLQMVESFVNALGANHRPVPPVPGQAAEKKLM